MKIGVGRNTLGWILLILGIGILGFGSILLYLMPVGLTFVSFVLCIVIGIVLGIIGIQRIIL